MNIINNTILITGGSAGIGFAMAKALSENGNHVIITGRDKERLDHAASLLKNVTALLLDVTSEEQVNELVAIIKNSHPQLNMLINNAGQAYYYDITENVKAWEKAADEINTNYIAVIRLTEKLLPQLLSQPAPTVVNVSSIATIACNIKALTYSASKAALHSYTEGLRLAYDETPLKVFEIMPPLVNTDFTKTIGGHNGLQPSVIAAELVKALAEDKFEIHPGKTELVYNIAKSSHRLALEVINGITSIDAVS